MLTYLGVAGWPVAHSRSPAMHNAALAAAGLTGWRYVALPLPPARFEETVRALPAAGFRGINVTIPHKEAALALADEATDTAAAVGAANTLTFSAAGAIHADNTDVPGLLAALPVDAAGISALGGAPEPVALLVNCTSVGLLDSDLPFKSLPVEADTLGVGTYVADMVYRPGGTPLIVEAQRRGAVVVTGLEILVAQGAASFERWTDMTAPCDIMRGAVADHV